MEVYIDIDPAEGEHERSNATVGQPGGPAIGLNCSNPPTATQKNCVTPGDICSAALARKDDFAAEVLAFVLSRNVSGISIDWEYAYGNNQSCMVSLFSFVAAQLAPHGKGFAPWVSNGGGWQGGPGDAPGSLPMLAVPELLGIAEGSSTSVVDLCEQLHDLI